MIRTRLIKKHRPDCNALAAVARGDWRTPWIFTRHTQYLDRAGTARGRTCRWLNCRCNDFDCPAVLLVHEGDLLDAIAAGGKA
jgi:hypothetical protein